MVHGMGALQLWRRQWKPAPWTQTAMAFWITNVTITKNFIFVTKKESGFERPQVGHASTSKMVRFNIVLCALGIDVLYTVSEECNLTKPIFSIACSRARNEGGNNSKT